MSCPLNESDIFGWRGFIMKKKMVAGLLLVLLFSSFAVSAYAFDFTGWLRSILGIKETPEEPTELFVPIEDISVENGSEDTTVEESAEDVVVIVPEDTEPEPGTLIIVEETDLVDLSIDAADPDEDTLAYDYTSPLDDKGTWQTTYGDAGEYTATVTVSDGSLSASEDLLIIVNKKEESPVFDDFEPTSASVSAQEDSSLEFSATASDLNDDPLTYAWELDGEDVSSENSFTYDITYDDAGSHTVSLSVSDGVSEATQTWSVDIANVNRMPLLESLSDVTIKETQIVNLDLSATDPDGDTISFDVSDPIGDDGVWETSYDDSGTYAITVTASDGDLEASQTITLIVEDVNRPPVIKEITQK